MGIGVSLILIAAGAILTWAVNATVSGVDINTIGVILHGRRRGRPRPVARVLVELGRRRCRQALGGGRPPTSRTHRPPASRKPERSSRETAALGSPFR